MDVRDRYNALQSLNRKVTRWLEYSWEIREYIRHHDGIIAYEAPLYFIQRQIEMLDESVRLARNEAAHRSKTT